MGNKKAIKIGVFDSGVGGQAFVNAIKKAIPTAEVLYADDKENIPYGNKSPDELYNLVLPKLNMLSNADCSVIVVACNTVSTSIIEILRKTIKTPLIAVEPMIKPSSLLTKSKIIAVCATPTTLASKRYKYLKSEFGQNIKILEPDCSQWSSMIEQNAMDHKDLHQKITDVCLRGADVIVLGCTHYHWIEKDIQLIAEQYNAVVIQPELAVIKQLKKVLKLLA